MTSDDAWAETAPASPSGLVDHFFRREYGRLVAVLVRRVGIVHLDVVEDAVQAALMAALTAWAARGIPERPGAWLHRVARNELMGRLRAERRRERILNDTPFEPEADDGAEPPAFETEVRDELLRMLFVCCDDVIPPESRLVLALKTLCGFGVGEIAFRLFTTEANVYKRLGRARERFRERLVGTETPPMATLAARLPSVHAVVYLLFNEGYLSTREEQSIRAELCDEALRLGTLLAEHPVGATPETFALLALMHLHRARLAARQDATGGLLLLEEQDRAAWDGGQLGLGASWLARAGQGGRITRFHVEAAIAAEHALSPSFKATDWAAIAEHYALLERLDPSPLHRLNRAVAVAEACGAARGLAVLDGFEPPAWLGGHYLWDAVLADLHGRAGHAALADEHRRCALGTAPTEALRSALRRRLEG